jgi:pyridinium-3,5-biscarboxylic acid mononucleotide synthase
MDRRDIQKLLEDVRSRKLPVSRALEQLRHLPFEDLGFAKLDHHRGLRQGFAEVIYAQGKTPPQVAAIARGLLRPRTHHNLLVTRANAAVFRAIRRINRAAEFHALSGVITVRRNREIVGKGTILVVAAGTSDIPVAE